MFSHFWRRYAPACLLPPSNLDLEKSSRSALAKSRLIDRLWRRQNCLLDHYCIFYPLEEHILSLKLHFDKKNVSHSKQAKNQHFWKTSAVQVWRNISKMLLLAWKVHNSASTCTQRLISHYFSIFSPHCHCRVNYSITFFRVLHSYVLIHIPTYILLL